MMDLPSSLTLPGYCPESRPRSPAGHDGGDEHAEGYEGGSEGPGRAAVKRGLSPGGAALPPAKTARRPADGEEGVEGGTESSEGPQDVARRRHIKMEMTQLPKESRLLEAVGRAGFGGECHPPQALESPQRDGAGMGGPTSPPLTPETTAGDRLAYEAPHVAAAAAAAAMLVTSPPPVQRVVYIDHMPAPAMANTPIDDHPVDPLLLSSAELALLIGQQQLGGPTAAAAQRPLPVPSMQRGGGGGATRVAELPANVTAAFTKAALQAGGRAGRGGTGQRVSRLGSPTEEDGGSKARDARGSAVQGAAGGLATKRAAVKAAGNREETVTRAGRSGGEMGVRCETNVEQRETETHVVVQARKTPPATRPAETQPAQSGAATAATPQRRAFQRVQDRHYFRHQPQQQPATTVDAATSPTASRRVVATASETTAIRPSTIITIGSRVITIASPPPPEGATHDRSLLPQLDGTIDGEDDDGDREPGTEPSGGQTTGGRPRSTRRTHKSPQPLAATSPQPTGSVTRQYTGRQPRASI